MLAIRGRLELEVRFGSFSDSSFLQDLGGLGSQRHSLWLFRLGSLPTAESPEASLDSARNLLGIRKHWSGLLLK